PTAGPAVSWAAVRAAAAAVAVAGGVVAVDEPCAGAGVEPAACAPPARFWARRVSRAAAALLPVAAEALCAEAFPGEVIAAAEVASDVAPDVAETEGGTPLAALPMAPAIAPESAPAKAFSSSVMAADTGSVAECFAAGSLGGSSVLPVVLP